MERIQYLLHARKRMKQRGITEEEVEACLQSRDILYFDKKGNPKYAAHIGNRYIKVVVQKENPSMVITVED